MALAKVDYFEHEADTGIIGRGETLIEAFIQGARAVFAIMADLEEVKPSQSIKFEFDEADPEFAFVTWLNLLIANARADGLMLCQFELTRQNNHWQGEARGEPWTDKLVHGTEVKGATLTMLAVTHKDNYWEAKCVVDV